MGETQTNETKPKRMMSKNALVALAIVCIAIASLCVVTASLSLRLSELNQQYEKESILANVYDWNNLGTFEDHLPSNINDLFQNKVVLWNNNVTESPESYINITLPYNFNQYGCLLINITYSTVAIPYTWVEVQYPSKEGGLEYGSAAIEFTYVGNTITHLALFPVVWDNSVSIQVGNSWPLGNDTQTMLVTYLY